MENGQPLTVQLSHEPSPVGGISVFAKVLVGKKRMPDILDVAIFFQALEHSGRYPLFTCECGCFGCGGYYVEVECTKQEWILRNTYHPLEKRLLERFEYHVVWKQVYQAARQIKNYVAQVAKTHPGLAIMSGAVSELDLKEYLADAVKQKTE